VTGLRGRPPAQRRSVTSSRLERAHCIWHGHYDREVTIKYEWRGAFSNGALNALHVDFEKHLRTFYFDSCGFKETTAGLIAR